MTDRATEHPLRETLEPHVLRALRSPPALLDWHKPLREYGLDSLAAVSLAADLEDELQIELAATAFWDYPTLWELAEFLMTLPRGQAQAR